MSMEGMDGPQFQVCERSASAAAQGCGTMQGPKRGNPPGPGYGPLRP